MNCPSCGAEIDADRRFAHLVVCEHCSSALILDEKAARLAGKMSALRPAAGPFYVGATGSLAGRGFRVLGRVRYAYSRGLWDEWYLKFEDEQTAWISEDEARFVIEVLRHDDTPPADYPQTHVGQTVTIADRDYHVDEKDIAICEAGEGQLPFAVLPDERVPFLDLSSGDYFATIEFELDSDARVFLGKRLDLDDVHIDIPKPPTQDKLGTERAATETTRERIVRSGARMADIKCVSCAAPLTIPDEHGIDAIECDRCGRVLDLTLRSERCPGCGVTMPLSGGDTTWSVSCEHCSERVDVSGARPTALGNLKNKKRPKLPIQLGQVYRHEDVDYRAIGVVEYTQYEEGHEYVSHEFLMWNADAGYRYLLLEKGHWSWSNEIDERPQHRDFRFLRPRQKFRFLGMKWRMLESAPAGMRVTWVDGELPWVAQVGDQLAFADAIAPPLMLSVEWTDNEIEYSVAEYCPRESVAKALDVPVDSLPKAIGVAPNQPYVMSRFRREAKWIMLLAAIVAIPLAFTSCVQKGQHLDNIHVTPTEYGQEYVTKAFEVTEENTLCKAKFNSQDNNSWTYLEVAVIDEQDQALLDFSVETSYYSGYEGGEYWTESKRDKTRLFKIEKPGIYRLLVQGVGGQGNAKTGTANAGSPVTISLFQGAAISRYFWVIAIVALVWLLVEWFRKFVFEAERWGPFIEDDDD